MRDEVARDPNTDVRRKILDVALELFSTQGYDRTSLRELSERLGFSKAALYYHFKAKADILTALAGDLIDQCEGIAKNALENPDRSLAARTTVLADLVDLLLSNRATAELLIAIRPPLDHTDIGERSIRMMSLAKQALVPPQATVEERLRASAALAIVYSTLDNLPGSPAETIRDIVMKLAVTTLGETRPGKGEPPMVGHGPVSGAPPARPGVKSATG
jgi:AcrR family transcriptional regulator